MRLRDTLLEDPSTSDWLKRATRETAKRDPLDALHDVQVLHNVLRGEWEALQQGHRRV